MVTINYQTYGKGFNLRLRLYQDGETKFINVNKNLQGNLQKKHWNQKRHCFYDSAPNSEENNRFLYEFKKHYDDLARDWHGSLGGLFVTTNVKKEPEDNVRTLK